MFCKSVREKWKFCEGSAMDVELLRIVPIEEDTEDASDDAEEETEEGHANLKDEIQNPEAKTEENDCEHGELLG